MIANEISSYVFYTSGCIGVMCSNETAAHTNIYSHRSEPLIHLLPLPSFPHQHHLLAIPKTSRSTKHNIMSFPNYDSFQNQQGQQDAGGAGPGAPQQQDPTMGGQLPDNSQAASFQGGNGGDPGSAGGPQQGGDAKTTLW